MTLSAHHRSRAASTVNTRQPPNAALGWGGTSGEQRERACRSGDQQTSAPRNYAPKQPQHALGLANWNGKRQRGRPEPTGNAASPPRSPTCPPEPESFTIGSFTPARP